MLITIASSASISPRYFLLGLPVKKFYLYRQLQGDVKLSISICLSHSSVSSSCLSFHPTFHRHTGSMEMLSLCQQTHHAHTMPSRWRQHHKAGTTEIVTVGQSWRQERKTVLKLDLELLDKLEPFKKISAPHYKKKSIYPLLDKYFNHISSSHSIDMKSFETSFLF